MSERDLTDLGMSRDRIAWEVDKWFWCDWDPQWGDTRDRVRETATTVRDQSFARST